MDTVEPSVSDELGFKEDASSTGAGNHLIIPSGSVTDIGDTVWYETTSPAALNNPPNNLLPKAAQLYLHRNTSTDQLQLWVCKNDGYWEGVLLEFCEAYLPNRVLRGVVHPKFADRLLKVQVDGKLSWVTA